MIVKILVIWWYILVYLLLGAIWGIIFNAVKISKYKEKGYTNAQEYISDIEMDDKWETVVCVIILWPISVIVSILHLLRVLVMVASCIIVNYFTKKHEDGK